jgi:hypothetical protein
MLHQKKIWQAFLGLSGFLIILFLLALFGLKTRQSELEFTTRYETLLKNFSISFELLDQKTDDNMLTAA